MRPTLNGALRRVLVHSRCNQLPWAGHICKGQELFPTVPEAAQFEVEVPAPCPPGRGLSQPRGACYSQPSSSETPAIPGAPH